jgi:alpha-beta hydrolase superfamily lysophospholipase
LIAAMLLVIAGLGASWFVAGALIAPRPLAIGPPPAGLNVIAFTVPSESGSVIAGWHTRPERINGVDAKNGVIVLLHGVRGSRLAVVDRARMLHAAGYATVMIDFQAHGESPGREITMGYLERHDVRAAIAYARREHPGEPVGVIGVSLGGAAAMLASPLEIDALVVEAVYTTIDEAVHNRVADVLGPLAMVPTSLLLMQLQPRMGIATSELRPISHIASVGCPVFVLSGTDDRHTTPADTAAMFATAKEPKQLWMVNGAAHVDLYGHDPSGYRDRVLDFLHSAFHRKSNPRQ